MDEKKLLEFKRLYQKKKLGQYLTLAEKELLNNILKSMPIYEERNFITKVADFAGESEEDIQIFIEQDIKRRN